MDTASFIDRWSCLIELYLFRHAAVEDAYKGAYNGHIDIDASFEGLKAAKENFKALEKLSFDAIFCSPLKRAQQTLDALDLRGDVFFSTKLQEKSWGRHEGKFYDEIVAMEGVGYENFFQWLELLDGEPYKKFMERVASFLNDLASQNYRRVFIMTHAGVIYAMIHKLKQIPLEEAFQTKVSYGSCYILEMPKVAKL